MCVAVLRGAELSAELLRTGVLSDDLLHDDLLSAEVRLLQLSPFVLWVLLIGLQLLLRRAGQVLYGRAVDVVRLLQLMGFRGPVLLPGDGADSPGI